MLIPGNAVLFDGIKPEEVLRLLSCFGTKSRRFRKGETVIAAGSSVDSIGLVLSGSIQVIRNDYEGAKVILASFTTGSVFAESFVCAGVAQSPVTVISMEESEILFLPFRKMIASCESACTFHQQLIANMMKLIARRNMLLNEKLEICAKRTIREKVLAYLEQETLKSKSRIVVIPFNRSELADYLCVDRSALSRELGQMQSEGLIEYERNRFTVHVRSV